MPYMSEREEIDQALAAIGFAWQHTGGGCTAHMKEDGSFITYITRHDDASSADSWNDAVDVGTYRLDTGEPIAPLKTYATLIDAIVALRS